MKKFLFLFLLAGSTNAHAATTGDAQGEFLAASNASVQQIVKLIADSNPEVANGQCDLTPASASFPNGISAEGDLVVRFTCTTSTGYTAYIDLNGSLSTDGSSVAIESVALVHTGKK